MPTVALVLLLAIWSLIDPISNADAQPTILQQSGGTTGTLSPLGNGDALYSDAHGNKGPTQLGSGLPSHSFSSPHGATGGTVTPFGTPRPPNLLTPAPLLPLHPKGMATPQPHTPAPTYQQGRPSSPLGRPSHQPAQEWNSNPLPRNRQPEEDC